MEFDFSGVSNKMYRVFLCVVNGIGTARSGCILDLLHCFVCQWYPILGGTVLAAFWTFCTDLCVNRPPKEASMQLCPAVIALASIELLY